MLNCKPLFSKIILTAFLLTLAAIIPACIIINENNYRVLTPAQTEQITPFTPASVSQEYQPGEQILTEIDHNDIVLTSQSAAYTWVRLWRPFCSGTTCENIAANANAAEKHPELTFMLVSETYGLKDISEKLRQSNFKFPVYVLKDAVYGHKMTPARKMFIAEMGNGQQIQPKFLDNDFLFMKDSLIFSGEDLMVKLDSILNVPKDKP